MWSIFLTVIAKKWIKAQILLMFQLSYSGVRYLSYESVKYSFDITLLEWKALLPHFYYLYYMIFALLHDF